MIRTSRRRAPALSGARRGGVLTQPVRRPAWRSTRRSARPSRRSSGNSARAPSCGWATPRRPRWRSCRPAPWRSTSRWASAGSRAGPHRRDLRPGELREDDVAVPHHRPGPAPRRALRLHRRRALDGPHLRQADRRRHRRAAAGAAGPRRAGARDRRPPGAVRRPGRGGDRLGRGPGAEGRDRGRDGRLARRAPGPAHVAGAAQAGRHAEPRRHDLRLHEPAAGEDRGRCSAPPRPRRAAGR